MLMYDMLEYSQNYSMKSRSLWNYYSGKIYDVDDNASDDKLFTYKTKIVGKTPEESARLGNQRNENRLRQTAVRTVNVKSLCNSNIFVILEIS